MGSGANTIHRVGTVHHITGQPNGLQVQLPLDQRDGRAHCAIVAVVLLGAYNAHPDGEGDMYRIDNTFSDSDHLNSGTKFLMKLGSDFFDNFQWIDATIPTGIKTVTDVRAPKSDVWYTIDGRRILSPLTSHPSPLKRGLYIVNGKLVVIK